VQEPIDLAQPRLSVNQQGAIGRVKASAYGPMLIAHVVLCIPQMAYDKNDTRMRNKHTDERRSADWMPTPMPVPRRADRAASGGASTIAAFLKVLAPKVECARAAPLSKQAQRDSCRCCHRANPLIRRTETRRKRPKGRRGVIVAGGLRA